MLIGVKITKRKEKELPSPAVNADLPAEIHNEPPQVFFFCPVLLLIKIFRKISNESHNSFQHCTLSLSDALNN